jgi:hypothetical protein
MAVGQGDLLNALSYLVVGRETTLNTYNTCTGGLDFLSSTVKTQKDSRILEQIESSRTYSKRLHLSKAIGGDVEFYFRPDETACMFMLQNAFGGTVTSATATGETTGGGAFEHVFEVGNFDQSYPSMCLNIRKGPSSGGKVFQYSGVKTNELTIQGAVDEPLMMAANLVCMDSTQNTNNLESILTATSNPIMSFVEGRISVETSFASLTSTSFWHVQSFECKINNNLKTGNESRRIGSDILAVLPAGVQTYELSATIRFDTTTAFDAMIAGTAIRFDTTTAFDAMIAGTELAAEIVYQQATTLSGSALNKGLTLEFQKLYIKDAGDPEISGPDGILTSNVTFDVLRDESASGYAMRATLINEIANIN